MAVALLTGVSEGSLWVTEEHDGLAHKVPLLNNEGNGRSSDHCRNSENSQNDPDFVNKEVCLYTSITTRWKVL